MHGALSAHGGGGNGMIGRGIVFYLHMHQPWRIREYSVFDTAERHDYFGDTKDYHRNNRTIFEKVARKSYRPMGALLEKLLNEHPEFSFSLSMSGTFLEQAEEWAPDVIETFRRLVDTGRVEIVAETYYHSLAFFYSRDEFERQVEAHAKKIEKLFGYTPKTFRNTELAYNDQLGEWADQKGYKAIITEGWDPVLEWRSPNYVYQPNRARNTKLLLKNYRLSDDVAFRFSNKAWEEYPLTVEKYQHWINDSLGDDGEIVNLFMDFETFGENVWEDTGIFAFFESFVASWLANPANTFYTLSSAADTFESKGEISIPATVTWADSERDLTAWLGNSMQHEAMHHLYALEDDIMRAGDTGLIADWRKLTTSDHAYYMCTKWFTDGDVHAYFSPYESPYEAFLYTMNAVRDVRFRLYEYHRRGSL